ncbi:ABC transporter permease [Paenibacillus macerans]|uniref:ABC transporter permease n=1 Tax=Paenibacillus macerans TaxID=44252 RepID=UPI001F0D3F66|nr:ABC transporter permease [Paenibacillus macerans]MEC0137569.1 ABC transporter permease [Paenibacillus macerans]UMV49806.1 ABC transporter permease [Paenibacillus macerans]
MSKPASPLTSPRQVAQREGSGLSAGPLRWRFRDRAGLLPIFVFFLLWEAFSRLNEGWKLFNPNFLPAPTAILQEMWRLSETGVIQESVLASTVRILSGFALGLVLAVAAGVWMNKFRRIEYWLSPVLNLLGPIPSLALLPIFIIWFGIGEFPKLLLIAWTTFIPVLTNTLDGLKSVNPALIRSALCLGAKERHVFWKVIFPSAIPSIFVGAQVSLGLGFSSLIVSEMMGAKSGLGYIIVDARNYFKMSDMFVAIVLIGLEFSIMSYLLRVLERRTVTWRKNGVRSAVEK